MGMTEQQVDLLLQLTSFRSDNLIAAVKACLIQGLGVREAAELHSVNISQLSRRLSALREVESVVKALSMFYPKE